MQCWQSSYCICTKLNPKYCRNFNHLEMWYWANEWRHLLHVWVRRFSLFASFIHIFCRHRCWRKQAAKYWSRFFKDCQTSSSHFDEPNQDSLGTILIFFDFLLLSFWLMHFSKSPILHLVNAMNFWKEFYVCFCTHPWYNTTQHKWS